jgi:O-antigen ligase
MASPMFAIFFSQAYHNDFNSPAYDWASRFLLCVPIFLALRQTNIRTLMMLELGIPLGAMVGFMVLMLHPADWGGRYTTSIFFNLIHFSDTALMLGFLSLFSINWMRKDSALILTFKLCGFLTGLYMSIQSGERGGWIAIPPLLLLWVMAHSTERRWIKTGFTILFVSVMVWLSYSTIDVVHHRINSAIDEFINYAPGNENTSIGIRLQLWQAALHLFIENPIFGVGPDKFAQTLSALQSNGMLTAEAVKMGHSEVHSEILAKCVEMGLFGLASILSIYLVPLYIFWRSSQSATATIRISGFMGACFVLGFFIFGLTVEIFNLKMTASFFSLTLAILMATATNKTSAITDTSRTVFSHKHLD